MLTTIERQTPHSWGLSPAEIEAIPLYALSNGKTRMSNAHDGDYTLWMVQRQGI